MLALRLALAEAEVEKLRAAMSSAEEATERAAAAATETAARDATQAAACEKAALEAKVSDLEHDLGTATSDLVTTGHQFSQVSN
jgi:predicted  nucleic acid-binding Zn-ribbon protein